MTKVLTVPKDTEASATKSSATKSSATAFPFSEKIKTSGEKQSILFVCTGNTCRSPMCAAAVNGLAAYKDRFFAFSAGLSPVPGSPISENAVKALESVGIQPSPDNDYKAHLAREVREADLASCDLAVGLTAAHAFHLVMAFPAYAGKICSFGRDISDPFGGDEEAYRRCLSDILRGLETLLPPKETP